MEIQLLVIFISILFSAFFSGMEIAFVSANKLQLELEKKKEGFLPKVLTRITEKSSKFITTMLIGNNIALVIYSYFMGALITDFFNIDSLFIQTIISTLVILITAEFLPKAIFRIYANEAMRIFAIPAYFFYFIFHYFSNFITAISDFFLRILFNVKEEENQTEFSKEELGNYITEQLADATDEDQVDSEIQIFQNALEFHNVKAREVMVPRTDLIAVEMRETISNLKQLFIDSGYSKIMVYKNSLDEIIGYVHAFEMFNKPKNIRSILLPVAFVPESMMINHVLNSLTKKKKSIAVVLDEYGGTSGIVTVEDVVEELFGEIEDEHDVVTLTEEKINDREYRLSARLEVDAINEKYNLDLPKEEGFETLGGLIVNHSENIPKQGEVIIIDNFHFEMLKVTASKIEEVYLKIIDLQD